MRKIIVFSIVFSLLNLIFIPLMALYGLSVCPVLQVPGFLFGCAYTGTFIVSVLVTNFLIIFVLLGNKAESIPKVLKQHLTIVYVSSYAVSTMISLLCLSWLFDLNHMSGDSRAPEILILTSLALCITQVYGLNWALGDRYPAKASTRHTFDRSWFQHTLRTMAPIGTAIIILIHFMLLQSFMQERNDIVHAKTQDILDQSTYIILFVVVWLSITYFFHFMSERENALNVNRHLKKLEVGDFDYISRVEGSWGLWASLTYYMNDFSKAFNERTKLLKSFSRFVTSEVAHNALKNEINTVSGEEQELTVIMSDIRDFTQLSQQLPPNEVVELLNDYFTVMLDEMVKYSITIDKFIGDGILAYVEVQNENAIAENRKAVAASLAMLKRLEEFNATTHRPKIRIGLGVCRGPLIKGYIGSSNKLQHTIIGDTVNRAARLESLCKELGVSLVISEDVWSALEESVQKQFLLHQKLKVKGIAQEMSVYGLIQK